MWRPVLVLAVGLVVASAAAVAAVTAVVAAVPATMAFVLGAVLASTDPVAVSALGRRLSLPARVQALDVIGLADAGLRRADPEARQVAGPRRASVFISRIRGGDRARRLPRGIGGAFSLPVGERSLNLRQERAATHCWSSPLIKIRCLRMDLRQRRKSLEK